jgi:hypothetical protein
MQAVIQKIFAHEIYRSPQVVASGIRFLSVAT